MSVAFSKQTIFEAAMGLNEEDRESLANQLLDSLSEYDQDEILAGAMLAERRIADCDRDPSRYASEAEVMKMNEAEDR